MKGKLRVAGQNERAASCQAARRITLYAGRRAALAEPRW